MSNALAIATVTQTLVNRVTASLAGSLVTGPQVSTLRPDDSTLQGAEGAPRVNIFLYQVTPNRAFRNADLPTLRQDGTRIQRPQLGLDLHYLFTFYGSDLTLEHQRLLGAVARYLHAYPVLSRSDIEAVESMTDPSGAAYLASQLSDQTELVRITQIDFSLDDMSKLWAAFPQTDFVLSMVYVASVVLIETDDVPPGPALPVLKRRVQAIPFSLSSIISVDPQSVVLAASPPTSINLIGQGLNIDNTVAFMTPGKSEPIVAPVGAGATPQLVPVTLPAGLRPGVNSVQLMQTAASPPASPLGVTHVNLQQHDVRDSARDRKPGAGIPARNSAGCGLSDGSAQSASVPGFESKGRLAGLHIARRPSPRRDRQVQLQHGFPEPDGDSRRTIGGAVGNLSGARSGRLG